MPVQDDPRDVLSDHQVPRADPARLRGRFWVRSLPRVQGKTFPDIRVSDRIRVRDQDMLIVRGGRP